MLNKQPRFYDDREGINSYVNQEEYIAQGYFIDTFNNLMIRLADRKASIIYNRTIFLSEREWSKFEQLLEEASFWNLPSEINDASNDGAQWVIEAHLKNKYHFLDYRSPEENQYKELGLFLY